MSSRKITSVPLTEKKKYAQMILKGASRSTISDLYRKKYNSELSERTQTVEERFKINFGSEIKSRIHKRTEEELVDAEV